MSKWLILILILGVFLRVIFIGEIPPGPAFDETQVIINSVSLAKTGQPIPGTVTGIFGQALGNYKSGVFSELASFLLIPWIYFFGFSWPFIKIPFVLISLGMIVFVYLIAKKLVNKNCALIAALLFAINPWSIHLSRSAYESLLSYLFYLMAIYVFVSLQGKKLLLAIPALILGFLSYFGAKPLLPPFLIALFLSNILSHSKTLKENTKFLLIIGISMTVFFLGYMLIFINHPASIRLGETKSSQSYSELVNLKRRISIHSPIGLLSENKLIEQFRERLSSSLGALSPGFLFLEGPTGGAETLIISDHGPMYLLDFILIIIGLIGLARNKLKSLIILLMFIPIVLIPNAVRLSLNQYILRDGLLFPILTILSASGIYFLRSKIILISLGLLYTLSFLIFLNQYFFVTPIDKSEGWNLQNILLTHYLTLDGQRNPAQKYTLVVADINGVSSIYFLFSKNYETKEQILTINKSLANLKYTDGKVTFLTECPKEVKPEINYIIDYRINCPDILGNAVQIASPKDGGGKYYIYNDKLCSGNRKRYPRVEKISDLNIEQMPKEELCDKWITNPAI